MANLDRVADDEPIIRGHADNFLAQRLAGDDQVRHAIEMLWRDEAAMYTKDMRWNCYSDNKRFEQSALQYRLPCQEKTCASLWSSTLKQKT